MLTKIKSEIAFDLAQRLSPQAGLDALQIQLALEVPKLIQHGHLAFPVFALAKAERKAPPIIAQELAKKFVEKPDSRIEKVEAVGGYLNFTLKNNFLQNALADSIGTQGDQLGYSKFGAGRKLIIDYASPNVAKPLSIGHLRAAAIGQAIRNLAASQGFDVVGLNHLGDWGVQFGKLAWAYENWGHEYPIKEKPFDSLYKLYVRFHEEAESNEELNAQGGAYFKRLEQGDEHIRKIWKMFLEISLTEYGRIFELLGVKHDLVKGEAFYNDLLEPTVERIRKAGLLVESEGAQVVFLGENEPPCIIKKSDGTSLYATRDLASAIYRHEVLKGDELIYVVGVDQTLHFKQVFGVLKKLGYDWADHCHHVAFGMYRFKDIGRMSTRKGNVIFMEDVLSRAIEMVTKIIEEKNPSLENKEKVATQVGVGAVIFNDLMNDRVKNVDFDWDKVLDFEGDSGPYVQYCYVRCLSLMRKFGKPVDKKFRVELTGEAERILVKQLLSFDEALAVSYRTFKPSYVAQYLIDVCRSFGRFYHDARILGEPADIEMSRLTLVQSTSEVIRLGLKVLGISCPEAM